LDEHDQIHDIISLVARKGKISSLDMLAIEKSQSCQDLKLIEKSNSFACLDLDEDHCYLLIQGHNHDQFSFEHDMFELFKELGETMQAMFELMTTEAIDTEGLVQPLLSSFLKVFATKLPQVFTNRLRTLLNVELLLPMLKQGGQVEGEQVHSLEVEYLENGWVTIQDSQNQFNFAQLSLRVSFKEFNRL
jgi:hypothetical protein